MKESKTIEHLSILIVAVVVVVVVVTVSVYSSFQSGPGL